MAFPDNVLSTVPVPMPFLGGRALPVTPWQDYESGGIAFNDTSKGLEYQVWRCRIEDKQEILIGAEEVDEFVYLTGTDLTECSLTFDQNMNLALVYVEEEVTKMVWYDPQAAAMVTTVWGSDYLTPRITLDDKRDTQLGRSDVIFAYLRDGHLYCRRQRDRYATEYLLKSDVPTAGLIKIGMGAGYRLQFMMRLER